MDARPYLNLGGETAPVDLHELDDDIRWGRVPATARLRYPPWTGERFLALAEIPELADALDTPAARLADHLRSGGFPWASTAFTAALCAGMILQLVSWALADSVPLAWRIHRFFTSASATGYEPLLLERQWWTPWSSQFTHAGVQHFLSNIAVIGYCGFRVERALGAGGYAVVLAASVLVPAVLLALLTSSTVVGSSLAGFGLFGSMIAIGFRFGDQIPRGWRRGYGFSNLWLFALLAVGTLGGAAVSHWGHAGGLLGGVLATLAVRPETLAPRARRAAVLRCNLAIAAALAVLPCVLVPALGLSPRLAFGAPETVHLDQAGISLQIPSRLLAETRSTGQRFDRMGLPEEPPPPYVRTVDGLPAWSTSPGSTELVFAGQVRMRRPPDSSDEAIAQHWQRLLGGVAAAVEPPPALGEGWTAHAFELADDGGGQGRLRIVEHRRVRGRWLARLGYLVSVDEGGRVSPRARAFADVVASAEVGEPAPLVAAREDYARNPGGERVRLTLAHELADFGELEEADALYGALAAGESRRARDAAEARLLLWRAHPERFDDPSDPAWFERWLVPGRPTRRLLEEGITWLLERGRCGSAAAHLEAFEEPPRELVEQVEARCR